MSYNPNIEGLNPARIGRELLAAGERVTLPPGAIRTKTSDLSTLSYNPTIEGLNPPSIGREPLAEGERKWQKSF
jgi:hypothetical protein